jgi:hypothetical protein
MGGFENVYTKAIRVFTRRVLAVCSVLAAPCIEGCTNDEVGSIKPAPTSASTQPEATNSSISGKAQAPRAPRGPQAAEALRQRQAK